MSRVVDDAKEVARAEVDLVKAQAAAKLVGYRAVAILFALAALLGLLGAIGLVVGLILTVAPISRRGFGDADRGRRAHCSLAGLLGWLGSRRWKRV